MTKATPVRVLVVDDEVEIAESLGDLLVRKAGYQVSIARDGREAMVRLEEAAADPATSIDLVLLDVRMPYISGPEVLTWLRKHPDLQYTRVIMLTAAAATEDKVEALAAGADDYITKPYYPHELLARVKTILRTQQLEKQLQRQGQQLVALNRVSQVVAAKLSTGEIMAQAVEGVATIFDVDVAAIYMVDDARSTLHCRRSYSSRLTSTPPKWPVVPIGKGIIGNVFRGGRTIGMNKISGDDRFRPEFDAPSGMRVYSMLATPLFVRGKTVGVMSALNQEEGGFSEVDRGLFTSLATSVGRAIEIAWLFQGIRQRQQELLESRNTLQAVIDGILHPIYTIDESWRLVAINQTKVAELERDREDLVGRVCYRVFFGRQQICDHCQVSKTLHHRHAESWPVKWLGSDRLPQEWDVNAYPIPGTTVGSPQAVVVWQDRTEERRLESSLMQAGKLAAIGQLAAGVAHEINNPLTAINANAEMLQMTIPEDAEEFESVELIVRAGERAARVVRGLLDFARQTQYSFETVDVNLSIQQALNLVSFQFRTANIAVDTQLAHDLPKIEASLEHLQSVWLNLLINARDALDNITGEKRVRIASQFDADAKEAVVVIQDTGRGMSKAELSHIFEPFYTTKAPGQGTGLGLATCHRIIEQHGGSIEVVSAPSEGTIFVIRLPLIKNTKNTEKAPNTQLVA